MEKWKIGKMENWKIGKLENWKIGKIRIHFIIFINKMYIYYYIYLL